jgi:DNA-binding MarR family transcriptional regulator
VANNPPPVTNTRPANSVDGKLRGIVVASMFREPSLRFAHHICHCTAVLVKHGFCRLACTTELEDLFKLDVHYVNVACSFYEHECLYGVVFILRNPVASVPKSQDNVEITLGLLTAVDENSSVTQRDVARELGIALGLANTYLKRCVKQGLIKVRQVPANRYTYYLTPRGFAEKGRLTAEYLTQRFHFFRLMRNECAAVLERCEASGWTKVALHGLTDISEILFTCLPERAVEIVAIVDESSKLSSYSGVPVVSSLSSLPACDAIIVTDIDDPQLGYNRVIKQFDKSRVLVPDLMSVAKSRLTAGAGS